MGYLTMKSLNPCFSGINRDTFFCFVGTITDVLILVLVEYTVTYEPRIRMNLDKGLNPCFSGIYRD